MNLAKAGKPEAGAWAADTDVIWADNDGPTIRQVIEERTARRKQTSARPRRAANDNSPRYEPVVGPVWKTFRQRLPQRPLCGDAFEDGVYRRPRDAALKYPHIEYNTSGCISWLNFDIDSDDSFECWERANLHAPNIYVQNRDNPRAHLHYALAEPIGMCGRSHAKPILFAQDICRAYARRLGADLRYTNRLAKNPLHPRFRTSWFAAQPYMLGQLLEPLDRRDLQAPETHYESGEGRNPDIFNAVRHYTYRHGFTAIRAGARFDDWCRTLFDLCGSINLSCATPLPTSELRSIARSVATDTFQRYNPKTFAKRQQQRSLRRWAGHVPAPKPWDALGISRATYYRRQRRGDLDISGPGSRSNKTTTVERGTPAATVLRLSPHDAADVSTLRLEAA